MALNSSDSPVASIKMWSKLVSTFELHRNNFTKFHLHITYEPQTLKSDYIRRMPCTSHVLPGANGPTPQYLTKEYIFSDSKLPGSFPEDGVIGMKLEGVCCKDIAKLQSDGFEYAEFHTKVPMGPLDLDKLTPGTNLSWSNVKKRIITSRRTRDLTEYKGGEICIFDEWYSNIETDWLETPVKVQYKVINKMQ